MARTKGARRIWIVIAGALLGALLGDAIGVYIHSDNLPFFDALGAAIGMGLGLSLYLWRSTRP
jgi:hypothetical protein